jgi:hypothetical protein
MRDAALVCEVQRGGYVAEPTGDVPFGLPLAPCQPVPESAALDEVTDNEGLPVFDADLGDPNNSRVLEQHRRAYVCVELLGLDLVIVSAL